MLCSLQTVGNPFILELGLQSKSRCSATLSPKGNINIWHSDYEKQVWKVADNFDFMESLHMP